MIPCWDENVVGLYLFMSVSSLRLYELPQGKGHQQKAWHVINTNNVSLNWPGIVREALLSVLNLIKLVGNILRLLWVSWGDRHFLWELKPPFSLFPKAYI